MTITPFDNLQPQWDVGQRFEATEDADLLLSNVGIPALYFAITTESEPPSANWLFGHPIRSLQSQPVKIKAGEFVWFASEKGGKASVGNYP